MSSRPRTSTEPRLIPYVTLREGEEGAPNNLVIAGRGNQLRLFYADEEPDDRDVRGVLWARCSQTLRDERHMPTGRPRWRFMHPSRQRETMQALLCQVCVRPARTPLGYIFLEGPDDYTGDEKLIVTAQPPVCARHVRAAVRLCPHLDGRPHVFLVQGAPLYGVKGTVYGYSRDGVQAIASPEDSLPYGHPNLATFLASQLVRRLSSFRHVDLDELLHNLQQAE
ncbi:hypothetical protein [Streptomyces nodosus]|uniref:hypothetical protein n=1 Tax=Streptomyces nodosus TaxID=40318 RepID=UPI00382A52C6